jgi:hopanoid C-2 methylase
LILAAGIRSDYRRAFWRFAWPLLKKGDIEWVISAGLVAHHLIMFSREAASGRQNASFYSHKLRLAEEAPAQAA